MAAFVASSVDILDLGVPESSQRVKGRAPSGRRAVGECSVLDGKTGCWDGVTKRGELPVVSIAYQKQPDRQIAEGGSAAWQRGNQDQFDKVRKCLFADRDR